MTSNPATSRFADYFVICGLDVSSGLEPDRLSGDNLHCPPLERPYKSKVLAHYPESVQWNPFDKDAVGMLCLPKGLTFRTQKDSRQPRFHSFIITREDGSRSHGATYVFFEEVSSKQICAAMQTLQSMYQAETGTGQSRSSQAPSDSPLFMKKIIPAGRGKVKTFDMTKDKLYVTKCICLITPMPFIYMCKMYLKQLQEAIARATQPPLPLESYVYNILYDVPLPPPGRSMKVYGVNMPIFCQRPGLSELPLFDYSMWDLFNKLGVENIIQIFTSILLEHQVLLYSSDYHKLMMVAEGITSLVFPFAWQHVYVPILPASLQHFLDAPVPFIMGLHRGQEDRSELKLTCEANMCFVDIDLNVVEVAEDLPNFPHRAELVEEISPMIKEYQEKLRRESISSSSNTKSYPGTPRRDNNNKVLSQAALESGTGSWPNSPKKMEILQQSEAWLKISTLAKKTGVWESIEDFAEEGKASSEEPPKEEEADSTVMPLSEVDHLKFNNCVREIFFNRFVHMFMSYEAFVIQPSQDMESWLNNRETMHNFDKAAFLSDQPEAHLPFLSPFIETQMFTTLIDNKIVSQWENCDPYLTLFDSRIKMLRDSGVEMRTDFYRNCTTVKDTEANIEKRATYIDHVASKPVLPPEPHEPAKIVTGLFPILNCDQIDLALSCGYCMRFLLVPGIATSHCLEIMSIGQELMKRGHKITLFAHLFDPQPCLKRFSFSSNTLNLKVVSPDVTPEVKENHKKFFGGGMKSLVGSSNRFMFIFTVVKPAIKNVCESAMSDANLLKELENDDYDLALIEALPFTSCLFSVAVHLGIPYAALSSLIDPMDTGMPFQGNIYPHFLSLFDNKMTYPQRMLNTALYILSPVIKRLLLPSLDLSKYSRNLKGVDTRFLVKDSLLFIENSDYFFDYPIALLPNYIQAGGMAASSPRALPAHLASFIDEAPDGVVLVTFGSILTDMPSEVMEKIIRAFHKLKQRVIFKHDSDGVDGNIKMMKWVPQNDILGHPNVKLFVSHCGKNGLWEGVYHAVPLVCTPFGTDMVLNAIKVKTRGIGSSVDLIEISSEELVIVLQKVMADSDAYRKIKKMSAMLRDRPETPSQRAASGLEHVVKYGGDDMKPVEVGFLSLIYADFWLTLLFLVLISYVLLSKLCRLCCKGKSLKRKTE